MKKTYTTVLVVLMFLTSTGCGGNLSGANFSNNGLSFVDFESSILQNALFTGSYLFGVDMRNSDLRGADLSFTTLWYVSMNNADLRDANLLGAKLRTGTNLSGSSGETRPAQTAATATITTGIISHVRVILLSISHRRFP